jgi:hypothetical protein
VDESKMIRIKSGLTGCRIHGLQPELILGLMVVKDVYDYIQQDVIVTCISDSKHKNSSLHYVGFAADLSLPSADKTSVVLDRLHINLGDDFDIVLEGDHIHVEFQPKRGVNLNA